MSCQARHYCGHRVHSWVGLMIPFFPSAACVAFSCSMKAGQEEWSFQVTTYLISSYSVTQVLSVFISMVLPSSSGGKPRALAIACDVWKVYRTSMTNSSKRTNPLLALGLLFFSLYWCIFDIQTNHRKRTLDVWVWAASRVPALLFAVTCP